MNKNKYTIVYTHKGIDIYTLAIAGINDEKGYRIDSEYLPDLYDTLGEAVNAIDELF